MSLSLWQQCLARLQDELPATEFSMWIRPLQAELSDNTLALYAPNRFVLDWGAAFGGQSGQTEIERPQSHADQV